MLEDFSDPHLIAEKIIDSAQNYEKYYEIAQILRNKHLKTCNSESSNDIITLISYFSIIFLYTGLTCILTYIGCIIIIKIIRFLPKNNYIIGK